MKHLKKNVKSPRNRFFYGLLAGNAVVLALLGFFAVRPILGVLSKHTTEITKTTAEITAVQNRTAELRKLRETYPALEAQYQPLLAVVPKTKDIASYQTELEELAQVTSTQLLTVDTAGEQKAGASQSAQPATQKPGEAAAAKPAGTTAGGFPTLPVRIDITGSYTAVLDFVQRLETMDRITKVTGLDLVGNPATGAVKATITAQALYQGEKP